MRGRRRHRIPAEPAAQPDPGQDPHRGQDWHRDRVRRCRATCSTEHPARYGPEQRGRTAAAERIHAEANQSTDDAERHRQRDRVAGLMRLIPSQQPEHDPYRDADERLGYPIPDPILRQAQTPDC